MWVGSQELIFIGRELWDFQHRFDTVRRFPAYGAGEVPMRRDLPKGFWVNVRNMPLNTADAEIQEIFSNAGIGIELG